MFNLWDKIHLFYTASRLTLEAESASYVMGTEGSFPGVNWQGLKVTTHLHLEPRSRKVELYLRVYSSIRLHGIELN
jgi:hypothetical protein